MCMILHKFGWIITSNNLLILSNGANTYGIVQRAKCTYSYFSFNSSFLVMFGEQHICQPHDEGPIRTLKIFPDLKRIEEWHSIDCDLLSTLSQLQKSQGIQIGCIYFSKLFIVMQFILRNSYLHI